MVVLQDRVVQGALDARLKVTVQVDEAQDVVVVLALDIHVPVEHDLPFGECARLIAAQNLHAAEVLDGRELLDQHLLPGHPSRAAGQRDRDDHRHHLRRHADGKCDGEEKGLQQRALEDDIDQENEQDEEHDHPRDHQPEVAYAATELCFRRPGRQALGNRPESGIPPRAHDDRGANPRLDSRAQEDAVARVANAVLPFGKIMRCLLDRQRLSGEGRLAHVQVVRFQQARVRRHEVSGVEHNDVPADQLRDRQFLFAPVTNDGSRCGDLLLDLFHRVTRLELHEEVQQHAEQDHGDDDQSTDGVAERERNGAGDEKDDDEGIGQETEKTHQPCEA
jgi:hypothetical protein